MRESGYNVTLKFTQVFV